VRAELARPIPAILLLAFILAGLVHMELGMRSIIVDYVGGQSRAWALTANTLFAALLALACVYATLRIAFT
jgi:succinate dehydrogenase / fumarate reductase membrane anchor subunit